MLHQSIVTQEQSESWAAIGVAGVGSLLSQTFTLQGFRHTWPQGGSCNMNDELNNLIIFMYGSLFKHS